MPDFVRARCRLIPDFWVAAAVCLAMLALFVAVAILTPPRGFEGWSAGAAMLALWGATPFYWLVACRRGCITFDPNGARWRTAFGGWKSARWDEIESCDARLNSDGGKIKHWKFVVQTRNGAFSWTNSFENADELAPFAARFCPMIPDKPEDWPRFFHYGGGENAVLPLGCLFLFVCFVGGIGKSLMKVDWNSLTAQFAVYVELYGWLLTLVGFAVFGVLVVGLPLLLLFFFFNISVQSWCHRDESFLATTDGLSWRVNGRERLSAAWDELQVLHSETRGWPVRWPAYRLQTARGDLFLNHFNNGTDVLLATINRRAPALEYGCEPHLREDLSDAPLSDGEALRFDFRTRSWRAMLSLLVILSIASVANAVYGPFKPSDGSPPPPLWMCWMVASGAVFMTIYGTWIYLRGAIVLNARGISWQMPLRSRFVEWQSIGELRVERKGLFLIVGARRVPLNGVPLPPAHGNVLVEEVEKRALNARGGWVVAGESSDTGES